MAPDPSLPSFVAALRRTAPVVVPTAAWTASATAALCAGNSPMPFVHASLLLGTGLVGMPLLFVLALGAVSTALWLSAALFGQWRTLLPGYWRAVRRVDRPMLWGAVLGVPLGTVVFLLGHGLRLD